MSRALKKKKRVLNEIVFQLRQKKNRKNPLQQVNNRGFGCKIMTEDKIEIRARIH